VRTREKAKSRRGGEREHFARLPESILMHPAVTTAPHHAVRALAALVCGYSPEQNGSMMLTGSYAAKFGLTSHDTLTKTLRLLEERGLIEVTRRVSRRAKVATLFGVTWWAIHYRNGERLDRPEPASHRYRGFHHPAPRDEGMHAPDFHSSRPTGDVIPLHGMKKAQHHPESTPFRPDHHPAPRGHSKNLGGGVQP
jgi:DNA-binding transcriptional ArsR family regulator